MKPSETDSNTGLSEGQCPQWSCREREATALPGSSELGVTAQPAGQCCTDGMLSPCAQRGDQGMASDSDGLRHSPGITRHVCIETGVGQARKSHQVEG